LRHLVIRIGQKLNIRNKIWFLIFLAKHPNPKNTWSLYGLGLAPYPNPNPRLGLRFWWGYMETFLSEKSKIRFYWTYLIFSHVGSPGGAIFFKRPTKPRVIVRGGLGLAWRFLPINLLLFYNINFDPLDLRSILASVYYRL